MKKLNLLTFFYFYTSFLFFWIRIQIANQDPDPGTPLNPGSIRMRILIYNTGLAKIPMEKMPHGIKIGSKWRWQAEKSQNRFDYHLPWMQLCEGVRCSNHCCSLPLWSEAGPPLVLQTKHSRDSFLYKSQTACTRKKFIIFRKQHFSSGQ